MIRYAMLRTGCGSFKSQTLGSQEALLMKKSYLLLIVLVVCLSGCSLSDAVNSDDGKLPGSDRDIHGCIGSAGYAWCDRSSQCERPWELAEKEGFDNNREQFEARCKG